MFTPGTKALLLLLLSVCVVSGCVRESSAELQSNPNLLRSFLLPVSQRIYRMEFTSGGKLVAATHFDAASNKTVVTLHDVETWEPLQTIVPDDEYYANFEFSPDGATIARAGLTAVQFISVSTGKLLREIPYRAKESEGAPNYHYPLNQLTFSPDGKLLAGAEWQGSSVRVWEFSSGKLLWSRTGGRQDIMTVTFTPDSKILAGAGTGQRADKSAKLWDAKKGHLIRTVQVADYSVEAPLVFSPDGRMIAAAILHLQPKGFADKKYAVMLWSVHKGRLQRAIPSKSASVFPLQFSADGNRLVTASAGSGDIAIREVKTGALLHEVEGIYRNVAALSPDGKTLVTDSPIVASGFTVKFWRVQ
jgi:WD40 repeat protein